MTGGQGRREGKRDRRARERDDDGDRRTRETGR